MGGGAGGNLTDDIQEAGAAAMLPKFVGAVDDLLFGGLFHRVFYWRIEHGPAWGLWGMRTGAVQPRC